MTHSHPTSRRRISTVFSVRYLRVLIYFGSVTLSVIWWHIVLRNLGLRAFVRRGMQSRFQRWARRFRRLATSLGGIWIKVGQFLSARVDVLPEVVTKELSGLQDEVPAEAFDAMVTVIRNEFGDHVEEIFQEFDEEPLASASLRCVQRVLRVARHQFPDLYTVSRCAHAQ